MTTVMIVAMGIATLYLVMEVIDLVRVRWELHQLKKLRKEIVEVRNGLR